MISYLSPKASMISSKTLVSTTCGSTKEIGMVSQIMGINIKKADRDETEVEIPESLQTDGRERFVT